MHYGVYINSSSGFCLSSSLTAEGYTVRALCCFTRRTTPDKLPSEMDEVQLSLGQASRSPTHGSSLAVPQAQRAVTQC